MSTPLHTSNTKDGLTVKAHRGDGSALLSFNLDAIEAIRLVDPYAFRAAMSSATNAKPLSLRTDADKVKWWEPYFNPKSMKMKERLLFSR